MVKISFPGCLVTLEMCVAASNREKKFTK